MALSTGCRIDTQTHAWIGFGVLFPDVRTSITHDRLSLWRYGILIKWSRILLENPPLYLDRVLSKAPTAHYFCYTLALSVFGSDYHVSCRWGSAQWTTNCELSFFGHSVWGTGLLSVGSRHVYFRKILIKKNTQFLWYHQESCTQKKTMNTL